MSGTRRLLRGPALVAIAAVAFVLAMPASAFAQSACANAGADPTAAQYCPPADIDTGGDDPAAVETVSSGSELPFTGLDVVSLLAIAVALTGVGLALRRVSAAGGERS